MGWRPEGITAVNIAKKEWTVQYKDGQRLVHDLSKEEVWRYPVKEGAAARRRAAHQATQQLQQMSAAGVVASEVAEQLCFPVEATYFSAVDEDARLVLQ